MEATISNQPVKIEKPKKHVFSIPLLVQSIKANWVMFAVITGGMCLLITIINLVMGSNSLIHSIDMGAVNSYLEAEYLDWLRVLGLFQIMGFSISRIQAMTTMDMAAVMNQLVYNVAMMLLPIIYVVIISNKLVASQVDNGSMAYVLSTPTNRGRVIRTQMLFMFGSILAMYILVGGISVITELIGYRANAVPLRTFLLNVGSFCIITALAGITFMASCIFNRSKNSLALGGGFCAFSYICTVIGLFGSPTFVFLGVGVAGMNVFNYMSIFSLFNTESINNFAKALSGYDNTISYTWIWEAIILLVVAIVCSIIGSIVFKKKDLPL